MSRLVAGEKNAKDDIVRIKGSKEDNGSDLIRIKGSGPIRPKGI